MFFLSHISTSNRLLQRFVATVSCNSLSSAIDDSFELAIVLLFEENLVIVLTLYAKNVFLGVGILKEFVKKNLKGVFIVESLRYIQGYQGLHTSVTKKDGLIMLEIGFDC